jgi:aconitate hydratase
LRDAGKAGYIIAGESYAQGSSREHAAICPMYLGIKAVIAISIERIHAANLVNFGILPLYFTDRADYDKLNAKDRIVIANVREQLAAGDAVKATVFATDGTSRELTLKCTLTAEDRTTVLNGGALRV